MSVNYKHPEWQKVTERLAHRRAFLLERLATPASADETALMRGQLAILAEILNWPESETNPAESEEINFYD